ncbi:ABC transporter ATP-binding protein [Limoniibacter endophyticus]|uniref:ABC transporter ATP-binding protein n=1 Tax=Limoniibacter endophyticus TaxID=1565040 RepID=A0A8J3GHA5_9HYPH|nr:ABC transporter ATP-binding protein [Limoniibacter endophyticus]GHC70253.1 ABC transporter ATP-binding protein [Limoniibacter endophyticus]
MRNTLLNVVDLRKSFGALKVTDGINFQVLEGEIHALIGPNGAGKTTLIHQLSGNLKSDSGSVYYDGQDITRLGMAERVRLGLARSFQITSILEGFSVLENVAIAIQARSGSSFRFFKPAAAEDELNAEALGLLARVRLADRAQRRAGALSHGEKRQLEIAIALATGAKLLLLDEPLAGTGHEEGSILIDLMRSLRETHTLVLIEHDMDAVFSLADRVSVLVYGRVIASGSPAAIRNDPEVRAAYLGEEEAA